MISFFEQIVFETVVHMVIYVFEENDFFLDVL